MSYYQYGFRKEKSTNDALMKLLNDAYYFTTNNKHLGVLSLDLSKAFHSVHHKILIKQLFNYGIKGGDFLLILLDQI